MRTHKIAQAVTDMTESHEQAGVPVVEPAIPLQTTLATHEMRNVILPNGQIELMSPGLFVIAEPG